MDPGCYGAVAYHHLLNFLVQRELQRNPERVSLELAALISPEQ